MIFTNSRSVLYSPSFLGEEQKEVISMDTILVCINGIIIRQPIGR